MKRPFNFIRRTFDRAQRRLQRARAGSVLILVVALLVLMALIATAFITAARTDRYSSANHQYNTQVDLLVQGVENAVIQQIQQHVGTAAAFRRDGYNKWDSASTDAYLAARTPGPGSAYWSYISGALPLTGGAGYWQSPRTGDFPNTPPAINTRTGVTPTYVRLNLPSGGSQLYPAMNINGRTVLAADTDGDGIADALFVRLPVGPINGVTYFAAYRVIDNGAALNANIAMKQFDASDQSAFPSSVPGSVFPTNVNLAGMLWTGSAPTGELGALTGYKLTGTVTAVNFQSAFNGWFSVPVGDNRTNRSDFAFTSAYEAFWTQLGCRLGNPGYHTRGQYNAFSSSDGMALAYPFGLVNQNAASADVEQCLAPSIYAGGVNRQPFTPDQTATWYSTLYDDSQPTPGPSGSLLPLRPLLVTANPVSNFVPSRYNDRGMYGGGGYQFGDVVHVAGVKQAYVCIRAPGSAAPPDPTYWGVQPWAIAPTKISVNTGTFGQLWPAYWAVMKNARGLAVATGQPGFMQFKSPIRNTNPNAPVTLTGVQMRQLRSALAAINTLDLRDNDDNFSSRTIALTDGASNFEATIFGGEAQPYITEALVHAYPAGEGYVAIELYNPFPTAVSLKGAALAGADRSGFPNVTLTNLNATLPDIPGGGRLIVESDSTKRPKDVIISTTVAECPDLVKLSKEGEKIKELYLLRTRAANGTKATNNAPFNTYNENQLTDLVPLDQLDFFGVIAPVAGPNGLQERRYHYSRASDPASGSAWHCVFPGAYNVAAMIPNQRVTGWRVEDVPQGQAFPAGLTPGGLGQPKKEPGQGVPVATFVGRPIQINDRDAAGPNNPYNTGSPVHSPFGAFTRDGDILQVPFIGSYTIRPMGGDHSTYIEMNSVSMDSFMADDGDGSDDNPGADGFENIGRFAPIDRASGSDDYSNAPANWRYHFALDLFDYLTTRTPQDDYLPNVDPGDPNTGSPAATWPQQGIEPVKNDSVPTSTSLANRGYEDTAAEQGRININTANWRVLASLPMMSDPTQNATLAKSIVTYRDVNDGSGNPHGPFKSIFELMKIRDFKTAMNTYNPITTDPDDTAGDFSPLNGGPGIGGPVPEAGVTDRVLGDFESNFLMLTKISNLITIHSDSFTGYVLVQGWRNIGQTTVDPELVVQRRAVFLIDRSSVEPTTSAASGQTVTLSPMNVINVPVR